MAEALGPSAIRIIGAVIDAGMLNDELYGGYMVRVDADGEHTLAKTDKGVTITISAESSLQELRIFAEDLLNGLMKGIENAFADRSAKALKTYHELENSGYLEDIQALDEAEAAEDGYDENAP